MDPGVLAAIVIAVGGIIVNQLTSRNNRKGQIATNELDKRKVSVDEFRELRTELREQLDDAKSRIETLEGALAEEKEARESSDARAIAADKRSAAADKRAEAAEQRLVEVESAATSATKRLQRRIEQLEKVLTEHDMPVPPPD